VLDLAITGFTLAFLALGFRRPFVWVLAYLYIDILNGDHRGLPGSILLVDIFQTNGIHFLFLLTRTSRKIYAF
jgi:hypothetical protein